MESEGYGGEIEHVAIDLDSVDSLREEKKLGHTQQQGKKASQL